MDRDRCKWEHEYEHDYVYENPWSHQAPATRTVEELDDVALMRQERARMVEVIEGVLPLVTPANAEMIADALQSEGFRID